MSIYLFIVFFLSSNGYGADLFANLNFAKYAPVYGFFALIYGYFSFKKGTCEALQKAGWRYTLVLLIALFLSILMAEFYWGQSLGQSLVLYRHHIWLWFIPLLCRICPSYEEIRKALLYYVIVYFLVWLGQVVGLFPVTTTFVNEEGFMYIRERNEFGGYTLAGVRLLVVALYMQLAYYVYSLKRKELYKSLFVLFVVVLSAQRAMLFPAALLFVGTLLFCVRMKASQKYLFSVLLVTCVSFVLYLLAGQLASFYNETIEQINDPSYNRWKALNYFFGDYSKSFFTSIFGNGFLSAKNIGGLMLQRLGAKGIYIEDIGMIGCWARYGVIPLIVLALIIFKTLRKSKVNLFLTLCCLHILLLPTAWTLIGAHYNALLVIVYVFLFEKVNFRKYA